MHTIKHYVYDSNFSGEFFRLVSIILLICQQRSLFNVFKRFFYFFIKNAFFVQFTYFCCLLPPILTIMHKCIMQ